MCQRKGYAESFAYMSLIITSFPGIKISSPVEVKYRVGYREI